MTIPVNMRILVVDNDQRICNLLQKLLNRQGYQVQVAQGVGLALLKHADITARQFRPHVAVVDLRLLDEYGDDHSGLKLMEYFRTSRCILYSAYLTSDVTREAVRHYGAFGWVGKNESPQKLIEIIQEAVAEVSAMRTGNMLVEFPSSDVPQSVVSRLFGPDSDVPTELVYDVLGQLFAKSTGIRLEAMSSESITPDPVHRGHAAVFKVWQQGRSEPSVVKLAQADHTRREYDNYEKYIKDNLAGSFYAILREPLVEFWDLGGLQYTFLSAPRQDLYTFTEFYRRTPTPEKILRPLEHFFGDVWARQYEDAMDLDGSLFRAYAASMRLEERLKDFPNREPLLQFPGINESLPNPALWVLQHAQHTLQISGLRQAITHGDLHGDNLFVDDMHTWAIDFERSGYGPILRDFVELEVDILTRLMSWPRRDFSGLCRMAQALAMPSDPDALLPASLARRADSEIDKAWRVIQGLRALASQAAHYRDFREYLWGLLLDATFVACVTGQNSEQGQRALLLGSVLCKSLEN